MGTFLEDLEDHEGYADRRLPDGRLAGGVWSQETSGFTAYVAACGCGWSSQDGWPPTQQGERAALADWREAHAAPLLARQADQRRAELAQALRALGGIADFVDNPANLPRIARAADRVGALVDDLQRDVERQATRREAGGARGPA
jgi:hypothetical protein